MLFALACCVDYTAPVLENGLSFRGHHLEQLAKLVDRPDEPARTPAQVARGIRRFTEELLEEANTNRFLLPHVRRRYRTYATGVLGQDHVAFETNIQRKFELFAQSPDDTEVVLLEGEPDSICEGCGDLTHCKCRIQHIREKGDIFVLDGLYLNKVERTSELLEVKDKIVSTPVEVNFLDAPSVRARRFTTTVGILKKILQQEDSKAWSQRSYEFNMDITQLFT